MKFRLFLLAIFSAMFLSLELQAGALIPACNNILIPPKFDQCLRGTENCLSCSKDAERQVQACLCFGQDPASYQCYMDGFMPVNMNIYYVDPHTKERIAGGQDGACLNKDNSGCSAWQYARGFCTKWVHIDVVNGEASVPAYRYCDVLQGRVEGDNCVDLPTTDGRKSCSLIDLAKGACHFTW